MKWLGIIFLLAGSVLAAPDQEKFAHITQDHVELDLSSGEIYFNGEPVDAEQFVERLGKAYSIALNAFPRSEEIGAGVDDLFGAADSPKPEDKGTPAVPMQWIINVLEPVDAAGLDSKMVPLAMYMEPDSRYPTTDVIKIMPNGTVESSGESVLIGDLSAKMLRGDRVAIQFGTFGVPVDFRHLLAVARALGPSVKVASLRIHDFSQVQVEAEIYELNPDGTKNVLTAPKLTTKSGNEALIGALENASGWTTYQAEKDQFHQEDLAELGISFSVTPVVIGEYVRVSGVAILTKSISPKQERFQLEGIPYYSYSVSKTVVPFSQVFPPGVESVEFKVGEVDDIITMFRLSAVVVDEQGKGQRRKVRGSAPPWKK
ncbi:hypothetical protein P4C99_13560 [Pontiellaceae bacterium B1224]|nr:hypothetical protein [Pontiellaceae bacterium B1224]